MYAFKAWAVDENLELRYRSGNVRNESRTELEAEVGFGLAVGSALEKVAAQGGLDQVQIAPQDAVLVEYRHIVERSENRLLQLMLLVLQVFGRQLARQIKARTEQTHQLAGNLGMIDQRGGDIAEIEAQANLLEIARIGTQQGHLAPWHRSAQDQAVEGIVFRLTSHDMHEGILQGVVELLDIRLHAFGGDKGEIMNPELPAIGTP